MIVLAIFLRPMEEYYMNKRFLSKLDEIKKDTSRQVAMISRKIVISYCALAWAQYWTNQSLLCLCVIIITIVYFLFDIVGYFASTIISRSNFIRYESQEITERGVIQSMRRLDRFTFVLLWVRVFALLVNTVLLIFAFFLMMKR